MAAMKINFLIVAPRFINTPLITESHSVVAVIEKCLGEPTKRYPAKSEGFTFCNLASEQERLRKRSATAKLERAEILVPITLMDLRLCLDPEAELVQIGDTNSPIMHPLD